MRLLLPNQTKLLSKPDTLCRKIDHAQVARKVTSMYTNTRMKKAVKASGTQ